jgi:hypothetical protein
VYYLAMPRNPKHENRHHPLKLLREKLSESHQPPVSQAKLAEFVNSTANTIKMTEAGQRKLGPALLEKIRVGVGACWDEGQKQWMFAFDRSRDVPFSFEIYSKYKELTQESPKGEIKESLEQELKRRLSVLFSNIPERFWWRLFFKAASVLDETYGAFEEHFPKQKRAAEEYGETTFTIESRFDPQTGRLLDLKWWSRSLRREPDGTLRGVAWSDLSKSEEEQEATKKKLEAQRKEIESITELRGSKAEFEALSGPEISPSRQTPKHRRGRRTRHSSH